MALQDVGDQLERNKRNRAAASGGPMTWEVLQAMNPARRALETKKANIWPLPAYAQLVDQGVPAVAARALKAVYDAVAAKAPRPDDDSLQDYVAGVSRVRDTMMAWISSDEGTQAFARSIGESESLTLATSQDRAKRDELGRKLLTWFTHLAWPGLKDAPRAAVYFQTHRQELKELNAAGARLFSAMQPVSSDWAKWRKEIDAGWPAKREGWQVKGYWIASKDLVAQVSASGHSGSSGVALYLKRPEASGLAGFDSGILLDVVDSQDAADRFISELPVVLVMHKRRHVGGAASEAEAIEVARGLASPVREDRSRAAPKVPVMAMEELGESHRVGPDVRRGRDVSPEEFMETFALRGVNFGNWVPDAERQAHMNLGFEAMHDLADLLGVSPEVLGGSQLLGLAVGAQGGGKYSAHFVPGVNELNLTRTRGAGSLGHEYGHAIDHMLAMLTGSCRGDVAFLSLHGEPSPGAASWAHAMAKVKKAMMSVELGPDRIEQQIEPLRQRVLAVREQLKAAGIESAAAEQIFAKILEGELASEEWVQIGRTRGSDGLVPREMKRLQDLVACHTPEGRRAPLNNEHYVWLGRQAKRLQSLKAPGKHEGDSEYLIRSRATDSKKGGEAYWSLPHEMFARAFSDWAAVRLSDMGRRSDYLAWRLPDMTDAPDGVSHPYLVGEEAKTVFSALDEFRDAVGPALRDLCSTRRAEREAEDAADAAESGMRPRG